MPRVVNDNELKTFTFRDQTYEVRTKFKMFKFFNLINSNPVAAVALALTEDSLERLESEEMDMDDFKTLLEAISEAIAGTDSKN